MQGFCSGCAAAIMEFSAGDRHFSAPADFLTCPLWKMWNFFGDYGGAVAWFTAINELERARGGMKQSDRHASRWRTD
jgi:hypothetical protein